MSPLPLTTNGTLCFILTGDKILLLKKPVGLFGGGKWNAPGGKTRQAEDPEDCAVREVSEETGLKVGRLDKAGVLHFFKNGQRMTADWTVHVFLAREFEGRPREGREGTLKWFDVGSLPFEEMWEDNRYWLRQALEGERFQGWFYFSGDFEKLMDHKIDPVESEPNLPRVGL